MEECQGCPPPLCPAVAALCSSSEVLSGLTPTPGCPLEHEAGRLVRPSSSRTPFHWQRRSSADRPVPIWGSVKMQCPKSIFCFCCPSCEDNLCAAPDASRQTWPAGEAARRWWGCDSHRSHHSAGTCDCGKDDRTRTCPLHADLMNGNKRIRLIGGKLADCLTFG